MDLSILISKFKDKSFINEKQLAQQVELADQGLQILRTNGMLYLAMEERTGKTLTAIFICEDSLASKILVITKKKAYKGWQDTLNNFTHLNSYQVVTYHTLDEVKGEYDLVIVDEPHDQMSGYPKPGVFCKKVRKLCKDLPVIFMSATPYAQGVQQLFHQLYVCAYSPWAHFKDFYEWYKHYALRDKAGKFKVTYINNDQTVIDYKSVKHDEAVSSVEHLFITKTRTELGFEQEPEDELHYIEPSDTTKYIYNTLIDDRVLSFTHGKDEKEYTIVCDSPTKLRVSLHMIEGGTIKIDEKYITLNLNEKIDYIMKTWGDYNNVVIMYYYVQEGEKLRARFKHAQILQATSYAEGVDLSMYKHLVIYSQNFSTAKHTQRRARQANVNRQEPIKVHFLLYKRGVSEQVYNSVSINKKNFVDSVFETERI